MNPPAEDVQALADMIAGFGGGVAGGAIGEVVGGPKGAQIGGQIGSTVMPDVVEAVSLYVWNKFKPAKPFSTPIWVSVSVDQVRRSKTAKRLFSEFTGVREDDEYFRRSRRRR